MMGLTFAIGAWNGSLRILRAEPKFWQAGAAAVFLLAMVIQNFSVGFTEELALRGYIFQNSAEQLPIWFALLLNGWIFGIGHFTSEGFSLMTVLLMPIVIAFLVLARLRTGSIWLAIGWHTGWNLLGCDVLGLWGDGLLKLTLSDENAMGGLSILVYLLAAGVFFLLLRIQRNRIHLRGKLLEDGSQPAVSAHPKN